MQSFMYTIKAPVGMHARHAGILVKEARRYACAISVSKDEKTADAKNILGLMGLGIRQGDTVKVTLEGEDEYAAAVKLKAFFWTNF